MAEEQQQPEQSRTQPLVKPRTTRPRPESTIVANFMDDLDSMFGLTPEVEQLEDNINLKMNTVSKGERELRDLEARLRETEKRLARASRSGSPAGFVYPRPAAAAASSSSANPAEAANNNKTASHEPPAPSNLAPQNPKFASSDRPRTGTRQDMASGMAQNPRYGVVGVTSDYVMVGRS